MKLKGINRLFLSVLLGVIFVFSFSGYVFAEDNLGTWTMKAPMSTGRQEGGIVTLNNKVYVVGGHDGKTCLNTVEEYNPVTDKWTTKAPMNTGRYKFGVAVINNKIYIIGGHDGKTFLNTVEEYDPVADKWTIKAPINTIRQEYQEVIAVSGKIYVIGGVSSNGDLLSTVEEYDPVTDKWTTKAPMSIGRQGSGIVALNNKIYAIGGSARKPLNSVEEYDPMTDKWTTKAPMNAGRYALGVTTLNDKIYAVGGVDDKGAVNTIEEYDPMTDKWTTKAPMSIVRYNFGAKTLNGKIYAIGGIDSKGNLANTVEEYKQYETLEPTLTATPGDTKVNLSWNSVEGSTSYNIKRSETAGGPYTQISNVTTNTCTDTNVTNGKTYYYVVTAVTGASESANSNEASATPISASTPTDPKQTGNRAILEIKMINGEIQEYDLSSSELNSFLTWYNDRSGGAAKAYYVMDKAYNIKPFLSRQLYIPFDKIMEYEVKSYNN